MTLDLGPTRGFCSDCLDLVMYPLLCSTEGEQLKNRNWGAEQATEVSPEAELGPVQRYRDGES